jgi:hypothetical protein
VKRCLAIAALVVLAGTGIGFSQEGTVGSAGDELYDELAASLDRAEQRVAAIVLQDGVVVSAEELEALTTLNRQIRGSLYGDLIDRSDLLLLLAQEQVRIFQETEVQEVRFDQILLERGQEERNERRSTFHEEAFRYSVATSLASFALAFTFWGLGEMQDQKYIQAATIDEAIVHRRFFQAFTIGSLVSAAVGVVSAGVSVSFFSRAR